MTENKPDKKRPTEPCHNCHSMKWWWRENAWSRGGDWLCGRCHPNPNEEKNGGSVNNAEISNQ